MDAIDRNRLEKLIKQCHITKRLMEIHNICPDMARKVITNCKEKDNMNYVHIDLPYGEKGVAIFNAYLKAVESMSDESLNCLYQL